MNYNTSFKVKYYECEQELIEKIKINNNNTHDLGYNAEDVCLICDKLYQDEFCSVFYADDIFDDKIDSGLQKMLPIMKANRDFYNVLRSIKQSICLAVDFIDGTEEDKFNFDINSDYVIFSAMFSFPVFHVIHKCICQQLLNENIEANLLELLREQTIKYVNRETN